MTHGGTRHLRSGAGDGPQLRPRPRTAEGSVAGAGLVLASRGDALTPFLYQALERRYPVSGTLGPELSRLQRLAVAASSFRPTRRSWAERFYKSGLAYQMRSGNAGRQLRTRGLAGDLVLQVHALFEVPHSRSVLYVDCTHRQSIQQWPDWNPLRGRVLERWLERESRAYRGAEHLFAFSAETERSLLSYGVAPERVSVVGAGINVHDLAGLATLARSGRPTDRPTVLFVGNDFVRKGGRTLLAAFELVRARIPGARLQLVGDHPGVAEQPGVEMLGRLSDRRQLARLYEQATIFCLPSHFDPFPLVLLEAMAFGLPCVTTPSCGIPDMMTHGKDGVLVPAGDVQRLADELTALIRDPQRRARLGGNARNRALSEHTWDRVVERMSPVLDTLLTS